MPFRCSKCGNSCEQLNSPCVTCGLRNGIGTGNCRCPSTWGICQSCKGYMCGVCLSNPVASCGRCNK